MGDVILLTLLGLGLDDWAMMAFHGLALALVWRYTLKGRSLAVAPQRWFAFALLVGLVANAELTALSSAYASAELQVAGSCDPGSLFYDEDDCASMRPASARLVARPTQAL